MPLGLPAYPWVVVLPPRPSEYSRGALFFGFLAHPVVAVVMVAAVVAVVVAVAMVTVAAREQCAGRRRRRHRRQGHHHCHHHRGQHRRDGIFGGLGSSSPQVVLLECMRDIQYWEYGTMQYWE